MAKKFVPSGFTGTWEEKSINEVIEKHIKDHWSETDTPKQSEISFGYVLGQNVSDIRKSIALKCLDGGQNNIDKGTNFASSIYINKVIVHVEARSISNFSKDYPISLEQCKLTVMDIINSDPLALRQSEGIHRMIAENSDPVQPIKDKPTTYFIDIYVTVTRFMTRVEV